MLTQFHKMFPKPLAVDPPVQPSVDVIRARPAQVAEGRAYPLGVAPDAVRYIALYALSPWAYTAVNKLATVAAQAQLEVARRGDPMDKREGHGLVDLLGPYGKPNDYQSTMEFWREHWTFLELAGNSYWYWSRRGRGGGAPDEVYVLHPQNVRVVPGVNRTISHYEYWRLGEVIDLPVSSVTHFRKPNPFNAYYGLPAFEALMRAVLGDYYASRWNEEFFGEDVSIPAGIFVIPPDVSVSERDRIADELAAKHGSKRRTVVARVPVGGSAWFETPLSRRDMDFVEARMLSRQEVYEALDLPLGYLSETSTEAHARVAERQFLYSVYGRLLYVADKLNPEVMQFWPAWNRYAAQFQDIRKDAADWDQQRHRYGVLTQVLTRNQVAEELGYPPEEDGDVPAANWRQQNSGVADPLQDQGQISHVVGREQRPGPDSVPE